MSARLYVHRTQSLEALLQELWTLRPELKEKKSMTVYLGTAALLREVKQTAAVMNASMDSLPQVVPSMSVLGAEANVSTESTMADNTAESESTELHPDDQWD